MENNSKSLTELIETVNSIAEISNKIKSPELMEHLVLFLSYFKTLTDLLESNPKLKTAILGQMEDFVGIADKLCSDIDSQKEIGKVVSIPMEELNSLIGNIGIAIDKITTKNKENHRIITDYKKRKIVN